jgi:hypothetical protein
MLKYGATAALLVLLPISGCRQTQRLSAPPPPPPRQAVIREIQEFTKSFGFEETGTFSRYSPGKQAFYRCYYTGKLSLPDSYDGLKVKDGNEQGCAVDEQKYDVFFYRIEAVAGPRTPTTEALAEAPLERLAVVVPHEDFHQQKSIRRLPPALEEAAATLVGFLTAAAYAKASHGEDSTLFSNLSGEAQTFLVKSEIINRFHDRLKALYEEARLGKISSAAALAEKQRLFGEIQQACMAIATNPASFNKCPAAMNNAGLAFDRTYTKHYGLLYRLAAAQGNDVRRLLASLSQVPASGGSAEGAAVEYLEKLLQERFSNPASRVD